MEQIKSISLKQAKEKYNQFLNDLKYDKEESVLVKDSLNRRLIKDIYNCHGELLYTKDTIIDEFKLNFLVRADIQKILVYKRLNVKLIVKDEKIQENLIGIISSLLLDVNINIKVIDVLKYDKPIENLIRKTDIIFDFTNEFNFFSNVILENITVKNFEGFSLSHQYDLIVFNLDNNVSKLFFVYEVFIKDLINKLLKKKEEKKNIIIGRLSQDINKKYGYGKFIFVNVFYNGDYFDVVPINDNDNFIYECTTCSGYIYLKEEYEKYNFDDKIKVVLNKDIESIEKDISFFAKKNKINDTVISMLNHKGINLKLCFNNFSKNLIKALEYSLPKSIEKKVFLKDFINSKKYFVINGVSEKYGIAVKREDIKTRDDLYKIKSFGASDKIRIFEEKLKNITEISFYDNIYTDESKLINDVVNGKIDACFISKKVANQYGLKLVYTFYKENDYLIDKSFDEKILNNVISVLISDELKKEMEKVDYYNTKNIGEILGFSFSKGGLKMDVKEMSLKLHEELNGKIEVISKKEIKTSEDLSLLYTPGVATPCEKIHENKSDVYKYTSKKNLVGVVSDGSAVLGLGNIGSYAAIPVMEGKSILFKEFSGVDAFPICLDTQDTDKIVETVKLISPVFGGINLEDISSPRCVEIENRLKEELDIPVFHDDQHGTAIVVGAGIINALKIVKKDIDKIKIVVNGDGSAGYAITKMLVNLGARNVVVCGINGSLTQEDKNNNYVQNEIVKTTKQEEKGLLKDVLKGADVLVGVSKGNLVNKEMVKTMNKDCIIFAMANPTPEIMPEEAKAGGARIVGTGRSDFANQVNNVLAFPGIFRGALDAYATKITEQMKVKATFAIANFIKDEDLNEDYILPSALNKDVAKVVAKAVYDEAIKQGVVKNIK